MNSSSNESEREEQSKKDEAEAKFKKELRLLAKGLKKDDLLAFLSDECKENPALMDAFLLRFVTDESQAPPFDYSLMISQAAQRAETEWGSLEEYPIREVIEKLNLRALQQYHNGKLEDTLQICGATLRHIPPLLENLPDSIGIESSYLLCIDILRKLIKSSEVPQVESDAKALAIDLLLTKYLDESGYDEAIWEVIYEASLNAEEFAALMSHIDTAISSLQFSPKDLEWEMTDWLLRKIELLKMDTSVEDSMEAMRPFIGFTEIRDLFIEKEIEAGRMDEAKELILAGIAKATESEKIATIFQYQTKLLEIAVREGDKATIRNLAGKLFLAEGQFNFEYYELLKSTYNEIEWKTKVMELIAGIGGGIIDVHFDQASIIATILERENEFEKLLILLRENTSTFELIQAHYQSLEEDYNVEVIQIFQLSIEEYARDNSGRPAYSRLVQMLKFMGRVKGASPFVRSVIRTLKQRYPRRTALIDLLNQAFN